MKYIIMCSLLLLSGCAKKALNQLEYDMLVATDNQTHIALEEMEQNDKNIITRKKETHEAIPVITYRPGFVDRVNTVDRLQSTSGSKTA